ncbi:MAG: hypothetical protein LRS49_04730 [Desulfurococcales archaeon]|nr:hypothetical protein [Desulfurococcales archaeon]
MGTAGRLAALRRLARGEPLLVSLIIASLVLAAVSPGFREGFPRFIRPGVLAVLAGLMSGSLVLEASGALGAAAEAVVAAAGDAALSVLLLGAGMGLLASLVTNDASLFVAVPLAAAVAERSGAPRGLAVGLVTAFINIGSSLLPVGSPQNLLVWHEYRPGIGAYVAAMAPMVALGYAALAAWGLRLLPHRRGGVAAPPPVKVDTVLAAAGAAAVASSATGGLLGHPYAGAAASILLAAAALGPRRLLRGGDWAAVATLGLLIAVFSYLGSLAAPHIPGRLLYTRLGVYLLALALSQVVSNVPATAVLLGRTRHWAALLWGADLGGALLLPGSMANIIALRLSGTRPRDLHRAQLLPIALASAAAAALLAISPQP